MTLSELRKCLAILIEMLEERGVQRLMLEGQEGYWTIPSPEWRNVYVDPELAVGSFSDDVSELGKMLKNPARASAVDLERMSGLLKLLSDQLAFHDTDER